MSDKQSDSNFFSHEDVPFELMMCRRRSDLSEKVALFNKASNEHSEKQSTNPFSEKFTGGTSTGLHDPNYGKPVSGTLTDIRGRKGHTHIYKEIIELCQMIYENGEPVEVQSSTLPAKVVISFGELFQIYTHISNKVVGLLLRARKMNLVQFEGEMLFQRRDDDVPILLLMTPSEVKEYFENKQQYY